MKSKALTYFDLSRLPEEYIRNEFPEYYDNTRRNKKDPILYLVKIS